MMEEEVSGNASYDRHKMYPRGPSSITAKYKKVQKINAKGKWEVLRCLFLMIQGTGEGLTVFTLAILNNLLFLIFSRFQIIEY